MSNTHKVLGFIFLFFIVLCSVLPTFAVNSSVSTQSVNIVVPETNSISTGSGNEDFSMINMGNLSSDDSETVKGLHIKSFSNTNSEFWVRASGDFIGQKTSQNLSISNLGFDVPGANDEKTSFSGAYVKVNNLNKMDQNGLFLNLYFKLPYGTAPDTYKTTIYLTSVLDTSPP